MREERHMKNRLVIKGIVLGIIVLFIGAGVIPSTVGTIEKKTTILKAYSNGYIQDLIDNASDGDTIYIPSRTYYENIVIDKSRYSGFMGTSLNMVLNTYAIKYLIFSGIATNVCVESTLRDAFFLEYWPILMADGTNNAGPSFTQQATLWNIEALFGWVADSKAIGKALSE